MLEYTQKAFNSQLRQKFAASMRYQPTMPKFPSQMKGIKGGTMAISPRAAEAAKHDAKTKKLQQITAELA